MLFINWVLSLIEILVDTTIWKVVGFILFLGVIGVTISNWHGATRDQRGQEAAAEGNYVVVIWKMMK